MSFGEIWRDVPSVPGILVSSEGRVMVTPYRYPMPGGGVRPYGGQPYFGVWNKTDGRFCVQVKRKTYKVHRLVAEAFHGPPPFDGAIVMHLDENAANNRADNLKWGTQKENLNAPGFLEYCKNRTGEQSPWIKGQKKARHP
ncbi:hypothetical protein Ga0609869_001920 [Rhodovulum iodosum]|uniref:HNH nuclease domain-containing protein n=1 Tax=Rhodovulum iodosum TaxID=68291 RepID=A0ABV3XTB5_9RHOB|nr:HNH endonuclease signature motif containing protein [Rhodovulum robiginosum]